MNLHGDFFPLSVFQGLCHSRGRMSPLLDWFSHCPLPLPNDVLLSKRICWNHCEILPHQQNISTICILPSFVLVRIDHLYVQALSISALHHEISQLPTRYCVWLYWSRQQTWQDSRDFPEIFSQPKPRKCLLQQVWLSVTHVPKTMVQWISRNT